MLGLKDVIGKRLGDSDGTGIERTGELTVAASIVATDLGSPTRGGAAGMNS
jgi:hypothetical protein